MYYEYKPVLNTSQFREFVVTGVITNDTLVCKVTKLQNGHS
jgi:hypothetical protein